MSRTKVLCGFILLFSGFLVATAQQYREVTCPPGAALGCECKVFSGTNDLVVECIDIDEIRDIPSWLPNNTYALHFQYCEISSLSNESFKHLDNLTSLTISNQHRQQFTFKDSLVFQTLSRLSYIALDSVRIVSLPAGLFANLPALRHVSISDNPLHTLPDDLFENSTNVERLHIEQTRLTGNTIIKIG